MKLTETYLLASHETTLDHEGWRQTYEAISTSIGGMVWPKGGSTFRIPRLRRYRTKQRGKIKDRRNGVNPIKTMFRELMRKQSCLIEHCLELDDYFQQLRNATQDTGRKIMLYPSKQPLIAPLKESVGDFDFYYQHESGFKTVVEWESGNISSSHRSLNKMVMALWANLCDAAVLVLPSREFYEHLTDRIGNVQEIEPYFYYFQKVASINEKAILAICVVEHDEVFDSTLWEDFIPTGPDGNSNKDQKKPKTIHWFEPKKKRGEMVDRKLKNCETLSKK